MFIISWLTVSLGVVARRTGLTSLLFSLTHLTIHYSSLLAIHLASFFSWVLNKKIDNVTNPVLTRVHYRVLYFPFFLNVKVWSYSVFIYIIQSIYRQYNCFFLYALVYLNLNTIMAFWSSSNADNILIEIRRHMVCMTFKYLSLYIFFQYLNFERSLMTLTYYNYYI